MKPLASFILILILIACKGPEPRKPVKATSVSFIKESAERNKALLAKEQKTIQNIIAKDTIHQYLASAHSSWYYYENQNEESAYIPQTDDVVTLTYNVLSLENDTIYSVDDIGIIHYVVDKQQLFPGLRNSIKLLKENEKATFLFPSSMGYGYHGDNNKIGSNAPLKSTITLLKIQKKKDSIQH